MNEIKKFFNKILDVVFPPNISCIMCGEEVNKSDFCLCDNCEGSISYCEKVCNICGDPIASEANICNVCAGRKREFDYARAPLVYKNNVVRAVHNFKYKGNKYLAKPFAKIMLASFNDLVGLAGNFDLIVPVPLHKDKLKKRGFNQAQLLAKEISLLTDVELNCNVIVRNKDTGTQTELSRKERMANLKDAFALENKNIVKDKNILIVDDILTTGATAESMAKLFKNAKANKVCVLTFARTDIENKK